MSIFKRMNFFKGLFTTAKDWQAEQEYHIEKRKLHNRCFYTPGIVPGEGDELEVTVNDHGNILVQPGYAIDGQGRDIYLKDPKELSIHPGATAAGKDQLIYIFIQFGEEKVDPRENRLNPEAKEDAFIIERPIVGWQLTPPDNIEKMELARIPFQVGVRITKDQIDTDSVLDSTAKNAGNEAELVKRGEIPLNPNPTKAPVFAATDPKVLIDYFTSPEDASSAAYVANVVPALDQTTGDARIYWRIESSVVAPQGEPKQIVYYLLMTNFGTQEVKVNYTIYRLNVKTVLAC